MCDNESSKELLYCKVLLTLKSAMFKLQKHAKYTKQINEYEEKENNIIKEDINELKLLQRTYQKENKLRKQLMQKWETDFLS